MYSTHNYKITANLVEVPEINCKSFYINKGGKYCCNALNDIYCMKEDKECSFRSPNEAEQTVSIAQ